jgi:hypothetical protein
MLRGAGIFGWYFWSAVIHGRVLQVAGGEARQRGDSF